MGLKTTNYVSKSTGLTLPTAYAILKTLVIEKDGSARAIFAVQATRENTQNYKPLDEVEVRFAWDRHTDPAVMAYTEAKTKVYEDEWYLSDDDSAKERTNPVRYGVLYGWEDDIVTGENI